jgi:hypothetical protein
MEEDEIRSVQAELDERKVSLEEKKLALDLERDKRSHRFWERNFGVVLPVVVTFIGTMLSIVTFYTGELNRKEATKRAQSEADQQNTLAAADAKQKRRLALLEVMDKHYQDLFSNKPDVAEKISALLLVAFGADEIKDDLDRIAKQAPAETKQVWRDARDKAEKMAASWYVIGGPDDQPYSATDELAFVTTKDLSNPEIAPYFLKQPFTGATGLARRLNPSAYFVAIPFALKNKMHGPLLTIRNVRNNVTLKALIADAIPNREKGRIAVSQALADALDLLSSDHPEITF